MSILLSKRKSGLIVLITVLVIGAATAAYIRMDRHEAIIASSKVSAKKNTSVKSEKTKSTKDVKSVSQVMRGPFGRKKVELPDEFKLTLDQAKEDTTVAFRIPKHLPKGAILKLVSRFPNNPKTIIQSYDVDGELLEVDAAPLAKVPDYKALAEKPSVEVLDTNPDGSIKKQSDGSVKWVRKDNAKYISVGGIPAIAAEPLEVKSAPAFDGQNIRNPGIIIWYANGTEYTIRGQMSVGDLLKVAESMQ